MAYKFHATPISSGYWVTMLLDNISPGTDLLKKIYPIPDVRLKSGCDVSFRSADKPSSVMVYLEPEYVSHLFIDEIGHYCEDYLKGKRKEWDAYQKLVALGSLVDEAAAKKEAELWQKLN